MIRALIRFSLAAIILLFATACSTIKPLPVPYYSVPVDKNAVHKEEMSWWAYRYSITWPEEDERPNFAVDLMLAHAGVKPVLEKYSEKLLWWRFHRRATRETPGHQFSFLFYTDRETATEIISNLDDNVLLVAAKEARIIEKTVSSSTVELSKPDVEAYSDPSWSPEIQKTWPSFIMGASAFWLALIDEIKAEQTMPHASNAESVDAVKNLLEEYRQVDDKIAEIWQDESQHVLFHHLSAVFGYKPMRLRKEVIF